jgi:hypothetical protein
MAREIQTKVEMVIRSNMAFINRQSVSGQQSVLLVGIRGIMVSNHVVGLAGSGAVTDY